MSYSSFATFDIHPSYLEPNSLSQLPKLTERQISNRLVLDLFNYGSTQGLLVKDNFYKWLCEISSLQNINEAAVVNKVQRVNKNLTCKRWSEKEDFLDSVFLIPTQTTDSAKSVPVSTEQLDLVETMEELQSTEQTLQSTEAKLQESDKGNTMKYSSFATFDIHPSYLEPNRLNQLPKLTEGQISNRLVLDLYNYGSAHGIQVKDNLFKWLCEISSLQNINETALVSKVHRVNTNLKKKRGAGKEAYLDSAFVLPTHSAHKARKAHVSAEQLVLVETMKELQSTEQTLKLTETKLQERRETVVQTRENLKSLKRKLDSKEKQLNTKQAKVENLEKFCKILERRNKALTRDNLMLKASVTKLKDVSLTQKSERAKWECIENQLQWQLKLKDMEIASYKKKAERDCHEREDPLC